MEIKQIGIGGKSYLVLVDDDVQVAEVEVSPLGNSIFEIHRTEIYDGEKGRGLEVKLVQLVLQFAREQRLQIRPLCDFFKSTMVRISGTEGEVVS